MDKKSNTRLLLTVFLWSLALIVLGRVSTQFTAVASTDVAFPEWIAFVSSLLSQLIVCARIVLGYAGLSVCVYTARRDNIPLKQSAMPSLLSLVLLGSFIDYTARFVIDFATGAIAGMELLALIWLFLQFLYEGVFIVLSLLLILLRSNRWAAADTHRTRLRTSPAAAVRRSVLLTMLSRVVLELVSIIEFISTYTNITATETASMIGSLIRVVVIYGGGALILGEIFTDKLAEDAGLPE